MLALAFLLLLAPTPAPGWRQDPNDKRPNIVFYYPDTISAEALGTYGHPLVQTPNVDRLAKQGVLFEQAHVQHTQCSPSRCAMLTSRYMHVLGHRTLTHLVRSYEDNMFKYLKDSGYTTIMLGKNDAFSKDSFNSSLTFWEADVGISGGPNAFSFGEAGYYSFAGLPSPNCQGDNQTCNADLLAVERAVAFLQNDPPEPFMIFLPGFGAHPPYSAPSDYFAKYTAQEVRNKAPRRQLKPNSNKPPHLGLEGITKFRNLSSFVEPAGDDSLFYEIAAVYYGRIAYVDYLLGKLLDGIAAAGSSMAESTVLLFSSDHGDYMGHYGAVEKWPGGMDDVLTHVPFLALIPGVTAAGAKVAQPVMSIE